MSLEKSAVSTVRYQTVPGTQLQYDEVSPAFTSLSQSSWYRPTRPKATFKQIKTYFASCLLDQRLLLLVSIVPWCGWSFSSEKKMSFSLRSVAWGPRRHLFFSFSSCGIKILRDSRRQRGQEKVQKQRVALMSFSGIQEPEVMQHLGNCQVKYSTHNCKSLTFWLHYSDVRQLPWLSVNGGFCVKPTKKMPRNSSYCHIEPTKEP